uniref:Rpn family recombination-promoting nuclease/putative transposase n=1 Tax=Pedobacter schmidteae TaxID=2201271 RepID=UPI000EAD0E32|nr:Rpn family recombination-promoting nuclease/putative transposase [Pedobacter schmidteae]
MQEKSKAKYKAVSEELAEKCFNEPLEVYVGTNKDLTTTYINPFTDYSFKRLFASEQSKPLMICLLNHLFADRKHITSIEYSKNEYPGDVKDEGALMFDVLCTDVDGSQFIVEVQTTYQKHFKERAVFYTSRLISSQAPVGNRKGWAYKLKEVYLVAFLHKFILPGSSSYQYLHRVGLTDLCTGNIFYDKLEFMFIEMMSFNKQPEELETELDKWLYALKHMTEFKHQPHYLKGAEFDDLFNLAKYANLNKEEKIMYSTRWKNQWDLNGATETAREMGWEQGLEKGLEEGRAQALAEKKEMALKMLDNNEPMDKIVRYTKLSKEEVEVLKP